MSDSRVDDTASPDDAERRPEQLDRIEQRSRHAVMANRSGRTRSGGRL